MITAVVLAAGAGSRLGGVAKALLPGPSGKTFLAEIADTLEGANVVDPIVVVGPPHGDRIETVAVALGFHVVRNPDPQRGMASSVEIGYAEALSISSATAALLWPVDAPFASRQTLRSILRCSEAGVVVIPTHEGRGGHPVVAGRDLWPALAACSQQKQGARSVFRHNRVKRVRVPVADPMVLVDIDCQTDLEVSARR